MAGQELIPPGAPTGSGKPLPRVSRLDTLPACRRELARVYREVRLGKLDSQVGTRLAFMVTSIARLIEGGEIERRLAALEEARNHDVQ